MLRLTPEVRRLFARTKLELLPEDYFVVHLPLEPRTIPGEWYRPATTRFAVFIRSPKGITLIVGRRKWLRMRNLFDAYTLSEPMRVITLDTSMSLDVYGYLAAVSEVLASAQISIVPVGAFDREHIVVKKRDLPRAIRLLRQFLATCKK